MRWTMSRWRWHEPPHVAWHCVRRSSSGLCPERDAGMFPASYTGAHEVARESFPRLTRVGPLHVASGVPAFAVTIPGKVTPVLASLAHLTGDLRNAGRISSVFRP